MNLGIPQPLRWLKSSLLVTRAFSSIGRRLGLAFGLVLTLFAGTSTYAVMQIRELERGMQEAIHASTEVAGQALAMRDGINALYLAGLSVIMSTNKEDIEYHARTATESAAAYAQAKKRLLALTHAGKDIDGLETAIVSISVLENAVRVQGSLLEPRIALAKTVEASGSVEVDANLLENFSYSHKNRVDQWVNAATELITLTNKATLLSVAQAKSSSRKALLVLITASTAALLVGIAAAWLISRSITHPMQEALRVAQRVSEGNLSETIVNTSRDEFGALLVALDQMQGNLNGLVQEVRTSARSIELASSEVASGNVDLSHRTEQTAANLQVAAASIEQLISAIARSAETAGAASDLVDTAAHSAERGGLAVAEVVQSMQAIAEQSRKITDIIGVIDGIAFQTNILALNAAVEAARAGEQGRGFAVVAGEVRNLAQNSASAAKDIKTLITASAHAVESGSQRAQAAGKTMKEVVDHVHKVNHMIQEMAAACSTQQSGINEVGGSMSVLDTMTQQNAALVEQGAAASDSLLSQARGLTGVVSTFTLSEDTVKA